MNDANRMYADPWLDLQSSQVGVSTPGTVRIRYNGTQAQISTNGGAYVAIGTVGDTLQQSYDGGASITTSAGQGPITFTGGVATASVLDVQGINTSGSIAQLRYASAPGNFTAAVTGLSIDLGTNVTTTIANGQAVVALDVIGPPTAAAKASSQATFMLRARHSLMRAFGVQVRNKSALKLAAGSAGGVGSISALGWDTTNFEGAVADSILTGYTGMMTLDGISNVDASTNNVSFNGLTITCPITTDATATTATAAGIVNVFGTSALLLFSRMTAATVLDVVAQNTSGTLAAIRYPSGITTTLTATALVGLNINLSGNVTASTNNPQITGVGISVPTTSSALACALLLTSTQSAGGYIRIATGGNAIPAILGASDRNLAFTAGTPTAAGSSGSALVFTTGDGVAEASLGGNSGAVQFTLGTPGTSSGVGGQSGAAGNFTIDGQAGGAASGSGGFGGSASQFLVNLNTGGAAATAGFGGAGGAISVTCGNGGAGGDTGGGGGGATFTLGAAGSGGNVAGAFFTVILGSRTGAGAQGAFRVQDDSTADLFAVTNAGAATFSPPTALTTNAFTITDTQTTATVAGLAITMTPGSAASVVGQKITMGANATGNALTLTHSGTGSGITAFALTSVGTGASVGQSITMTPGSSSAVVGQTITMGANSSATGSAFIATWASTAGNSSGIAQIGIGVNGTSAATTVALGLSVTTATYTLGSGLTGINIDLGTNVLPQTNNVWGINLTIPSNGGSNASKGVIVSRAGAATATGTYSGNLLDLQNVPTGGAGGVTLTESGKLLNINHAPTAGAVAMVDGTIAIKVTMTPSTANTTTVRAIDMSFGANVTGGTLATMYWDASPTLSAATTLLSLDASAVTPGTQTVTLISGTLPSNAGSNASVGYAVTRSGAATVTGTYTGNLLNLQNTPTGGGAGVTLTENGVLLNVNHAPIAGATAITDTTTGIRCTLTPSTANSTGLRALDLLFGANVTGGTLASIGWNGAATTTAAATMFSVGSSAAVTLGAALTGIAVDLTAGTTVPGANIVIGLDITIPASTSTSTRGLKITTANAAAGYAIEAAVNGAGCRGMLMLSPANSTQTGILYLLADQGTAARSTYISYFSREQTWSVAGTDSQSYFYFNNSAAYSTNALVRSGHLVDIQQINNVVLGATVTYSGALLNINHAPTIGTGTITDTSTGIKVAMTPASSAAVVGQSITMGANATAQGLLVTHTTAGRQAIQTSAGGNVGLGAASPAWDTSNSATALDISTYVSIWSRTDGICEFIGNGYFNGTNYIYRNTAATSKIGFGTGTFDVSTAASGTAGNTITYGSRFYISNLGGITIGGNSSPTTTAGQLAWHSGLGAITQILGPSDQPFTITAATSRALVLGSNATALMTFSTDGASATLADGLNLTVGATTGTKIGTATTEKIGLWNSVPVIQQVGGVTITNNVTVGGTTNQLDDFTSLTVYATDAAAIRNDIYQLGRKLKLAIDALRTIGALSTADA